MVFAFASKEPNWLDALRFSGRYPFVTIELFSYLVGAMTVSQLKQSERQNGVFSRQRFLDYCLGRAELAERLITIFTEGLPKDLLDIQEAVEAGDVPRIAKLAHRLKGASASMCAEKLSTAAATLERSARASDTDQIAAGWLVVEKEVGALLQALRHP